MIFISQSLLIKSVLHLSTINIYNLSCVQGYTKYSKASSKDCKSYSSDVFWKDIPNWIGYGENILRIAVFGIPLIMVLSLKTRSQKIGLLIYFFGVTVYFMSWTAVIFFPESTWSNSALGFMAPAYTTLIWFVGIGLIGTKPFFEIPKLVQVYILLSILFVIFHTIHSYLVFQRM